MVEYDRHVVLNELIEICRGYETCPVDSEKRFNYISRRLFRTADKANDSLAKEIIEHICKKPRLHTVSTDSLEQKNGGSEKSYRGMPIE